MSETGENPTAPDIEADEAQGAPERQATASEADRSDRGGSDYDPKTTDDEDDYDYPSKRLLPPEDTPKEEKLRLYLEDVELAKKENAGNYYFVWPAVQLRILAAKHDKIFKYIILGLMLTVYAAWLIAGCVINFKMTMPLLVITIIILFFIFWELVVNRYWNTIFGWAGPIYNWCENSTIFMIVFGVICLLLLGAIIVMDAYDDPVKFVPAVGWIVMTILMAYLSLYPHRIWWRPIFWGYGLGFIFALFVLRTTAGISMIEFLSKQITQFLGYADYGAEFVFGKHFQQVWAFFVLPVIIYFAAVVTFLFYTGFLGYIIEKLSWLMERTIKASGPECLVATANIFVGMTESPLLILPFINDLTRAEMFTVITCGFASIAGSILGGLISFGADTAQLLTAVFTSAPIALSCAKAMHPEIEKSKFRGGEKVKTGGSDFFNFLDAFAGGASQAIPLVANIAAMLIAFLSIIEFFNGVISWMGEMLDFYEMGTRADGTMGMVPSLDAELLLAYIFYPFALLSGVELEDCLLSGQYMGMRFFINEFAAFIDLGADAARRDTQCCMKRDVNDNIIWLNKRSEAITTYALCGFANLGSLGIVIGAFGAMAPTRKEEISKNVFWALIAANFACLIRAAIAGILYNTEWTDPCSTRTMYPGCTVVVVPDPTMSPGQSDKLDDHISMWVDSNFPTSAP